ncbi:polysaccharide lyase family 1 protein [Streptomyces flavochromogenes]|uniref:Polysaccharide lyase family 1 protein n=1 Tax=Streptomyces flavochromogenes TaxID=68199 RepID=A0ABW6XS93_9ACTN|nr:polysaccharide lyase family 1 protein [Streptomyces flavochromogenes]
MNRRTRLGVVAATALTLTVTAPTAGAHAAPRPGTDPARATLPAGDGWASEGTGTTGGAAAVASRVFTVTTWEEFRDALAVPGTEPRIVKVVGTLNATAAGCAAFEAAGYDFARYLADYDPAVWGYENVVSGPQEDLRAASATAQGEAIKVRVPANTTIVGVGEHAGITGGSLQVQGVDNVVVRNLTMESPLDCFPQWDPTDGATGAWNSEYDSLVVYGSTHVWIEHNTFTDGAHPDSSLPSYYGEVYQQHDGELDVVRGADLVTISWNAFTDHDKTLMIGNSDSAGATDRGKLRVTLHHNLFKNVIERAPRVRFGQVDAYNNHFVVPSSAYAYSLGIGQESQLFAEKNAFTLAGDVPAGKILKKWKDAPVTTVGNYVNGRPVDLLAVHNAQFPDELLRADAGWTPVLRTRVDHPRAVPALVGHRAGAGRSC